tara:strand:+ start:2418 stop:3479 length:1062 start_codon:yes stop_codon:yes gene_type:complete
MYHLRFLYIFFLVLALNIFFFSTAHLNAKVFLVDEIQISEKLENNFNKDILINRGFKVAFKKLISTLVKSRDIEKTSDITLNEIKSMIEIFSIKEEKFIDKNYYLNLGVTFNKKKIFKYLEVKSIFPSQIIKKNFLFIPIIIDQSDNDLLIFSNNPVYESWNKVNENFFLIKYILAAEDLEDFNLIKQNYSNLENFDFKEIIKKYSLDYSIAALIFRDNDEVKILSQIYAKDKKIIKNNSFKNIDLDNEEDLKILIKELKIIYEDFWKDYNLINTSIKLPLSIQIDNKDFNLLSEFEKTLNEVNLINNYSISKFNKDYIFYKVIFNGTPKNFINIMKDKNYNFDTQNKVWILK